MIFLVINLSVLFRKGICGLEFPTSSNTAQVFFRMDMDPIRAVYYTETVSGPAHSCPEAT